MPAPRVLYLSWAVEAHSEAGALPDAEVLTEYDIIICEPTFHALWRNGGLPRFDEARQSIDPLPYFQELRRRQKELTAFLERGGVLVLFLSPPSILVNPTSVVSPLFALELVRANAKDIPIVRGSGSSYEILSPDHIMSSYLQYRPKWTATMTSGVFAEDPFAFPLATSSDGRNIAFEERVGAGAVFWVPPPIET